MYISINGHILEFIFITKMQLQFNNTSGLVESNKPKLRTNPNFKQTQSSNKSKLRTNPNFEQIHEQTKKFLALGGLRIIRP